jgi:alpha-ribazole phosphatase
MEIYLIRHTTPAVEHGICYGQSDIDVADSFEEEAKLIATHLPAYIQFIISSPLKRCKKLADFLFPGHDIKVSNDLKEIHFGKWELKKWSDIPASELQPWMNNFVDVTIPYGESYMQMHSRVIKGFNEVAQLNLPAAIITHGGVIRSILSYITNTSLNDAFTLFSLCYGCVIKLASEGNGIYYTPIKSSDQFYG